ncbi:MULTISPECIES: L,D-transpeptidase family protein [Legionella]|uniref:L,D-transpeptidase family protein n=1 Tax=Legionella resiliens TaxID=2905958 RepID=A0ABS8X2A5_9GAMM|nr:MULTISPECIES: L,D-transpeptidase family protein [unclassified Legionella]MCE0723718.1 L,D-transpeptidase family protein [Legionella sp. 9fVS26]MCE3532870.1 L,D-transpeptidase family protein [Legionella sp. 8cVS16]
MVAHLQNLPDCSSQVILVNHIKGFEAEVTACKKHGHAWKQVWSSFPAVVGKSGVAPLGEKREGDMKTPAGLYPLGDAFGSEPLALKMDFKYITADDKFIDDVSHSGYNTWVKGNTNAKSYETMLIDAYRIGAIVNYNMNPVIPGAGSAIFIHLWRSIHSGTYGCIAMDEPHLLKLLHWLDKDKHPYILISGKFS